MLSRKSAGKHPSRMANPVLSLITHVGRSGSKLSHEAERYAWANRSLQGIDNMERRSGTYIGTSDRPVRGHQYHGTQHTADSHHHGSCSCVMGHLAWLRQYSLSHAHCHSHVIRTSRFQSLPGPHPEYIQCITQSNEHNIQL